MSAHRGLCMTDAKECVYKNILNIQNYRNTLNTIEQGLELNSTIG